MGAKNFQSFFEAPAMKEALEPIHKLAKILEEGLIDEIMGCNGREPSSELELEPLVVKLNAAGFEDIAMALEAAIAPSHSPDTLVMNWADPNESTKESEALPEDRMLAHEAFTEPDEQRFEDAAPPDVEVDDGIAKESEIDSVATGRQSADREVQPITSEVVEQDKPLADSVGAQASTEDANEKPASENQTSSVIAVRPRVGRTKLPAKKPGPPVSVGRNLRSNNARKDPIANGQRSPTSSSSTLKRPAAKAAIKDAGEDTELPDVDHAIGNEAPSQLDSVSPDSEAGEDTELPDVDHAIGNEAPNEAPNQLDSVSADNEALENLVLPHVDDAIAPEPGN